MKIIIVDDEKAVRNSISNIIAKNFPEADISAMGSTVEEGYELIVKHKPDILFLDVEMPDGTGFDLLNSLPSITFRVIFITAHQEYALQAIKVSALDFLLKPFSEDELCRAMEKAKQFANKNEEEIKIRALQENLKEKKVLKRIVLSTAEDLHLVDLANIIRAEADNNYTTFILNGGKKIMVSRTIKEFEKLLAGSEIIRVHQSHIVNLSYVDRFVKRDGGYLELKDKGRIPVSQNLRKFVITSIKDSLYR